MKVSPDKRALSDSRSIARENQVAQPGPQSLFSLLLEIESRLRKEARNNARAHICQRNISKVRGQKAPRLEYLSRYIE